MTDTERTEITALIEEVLAQKLGEVKDFDQEINIDLSKSDTETDEEYEKRLKYIYVMAMDYRGVMQIADDGTVSFTGEPAVGYLDGNGMLKAYGIETIKTLSEEQLAAIEEKYQAYVANHTASLKEYNDNATAKVSAYDSNASDKTTAFDTNYTTKKSTIDTTISDAEASIADSLKNIKDYFYQAGSSARSAANSATAASESATNASNSATAASESATKAETAKTDTEALKTSVESTIATAESSIADSVQLAKDWANKFNTDTDDTLPVDGYEYSAKYYAKFAGELEKNVRVYLEKNIEIVQEAVENSQSSATAASASATSASESATSANEAYNNALKLNKKVTALTGMVMWYTSYNIPDNVLICDGSVYDPNDYPELYAVIGARFGYLDTEGEYHTNGSGVGSYYQLAKFRVPDLVTANRFIRASGLSDEDGETYPSIGTTQTDAIRNITGKFLVDNFNFEMSGAAPAGTFYCTSKDNKNDLTNKYTSDYNSGFMQFEANVDKNSYGNPMAGHAAGSDIHPANIALLPVIFY